LWKSAGAAVRKWAGYESQ